jgi:hypothetical protein
MLGGVGEMGEADLLDVRRFASDGAFVEVLSVRGLRSVLKTLFWLWKVRGGAFDRTKVGRVAADNVR